MDAALLLEVEKVAQRMAQGTLLENLWLILTYSAILLVGSLVVQHFAFTRGYGSKRGELEAVNDKFSEILEQMKLQTAAVQLMSNQIQDRFAVVAQRRDRLEKLFTLLQKHDEECLSLINVANHPVELRSQIKHDPYGTARVLQEVLSLAWLYFPRAQISTEKWMSESGHLAKEVLQKIENGSQISLGELNAASQRLLKSNHSYMQALIEEYSEECGLDPDITKLAQQSEELASYMHRLNEMASHPRTAASKS